MQHQESGAALSCLDPRRHAHNAVQAQSRRLKTNNFLAHGGFPFPVDLAAAL
jgi:hypothetical protein